jgi:excisionase family DNA binding protein
MTAEGGDMSEILAVGVAEAARRLGVSHRTVGYLIARGELYSLKIGRRRVIPVSALEELTRASTGVLITKSEIRPHYSRWMQQARERTMNSLRCEAVARAMLGEPLKREGVELLYRCSYPERHRNGDVHPSLKVNTKKNVWACFPCNAKGKAWALAAFLACLDPGDKAAVIASLKELGLLNGAKGRRKKDADRNPVHTYTYTDAHGIPKVRKLRYEPKSFSWQRLENGAWLDGLAGIKTPLYRLYEIQNEQMVVCVEGEKAADAGVMLGLATTTSGGVNTFRRDHAEALRGKDVVIFPDNDPPGIEDAQRVAAMVQGIAKSIRVVELPSLPHKGDLYDYVQAGGTRDSLLKLIRNAPVWKASLGSEILDSAFAFVRRYHSLRDCEARAVVLWVAHTHAFDAADFTPYLSITSAEKECGKSRLLELLKLLVAKPWYTGRVSSAVLIRKTDAEQPTLLLDEGDSAFGGEREYAEVLRGVLNTGYERDGAASCCVGKAGTSPTRTSRRFARRRSQASGNCRTPWHRAASPYD